MPITTGRPFCSVEDDWECPRPDFCRPIECGDGFRSFSETCDDGNTQSADGCSDDCRTIEVGWQCLTPGTACTPVCGDQIVIFPEQCDDGCTRRCQRDPNVVCVGGTCTLSVCGNGVVEPGEACDLGEDNAAAAGDGQGCSLECTTEPVCEPSAAGELVCPAVCGNADLEADEECDDGNSFATDGCSPECRIEVGFACTPIEFADRTTSQCGPRCGDGVVAGDELCDDGDANGTQEYGGCTAGCTLGGYCGDGIVNEHYEECDDGPSGFVAYGEGCTPTCTVAPFCGDGIRDDRFGEQCDLGSANIEDNYCTTDCCLVI